MLAQKSISHAGVCVLCDDITESNQHNFLECAYVSHIWDSLKKKLHITSSPLHMTDLWTTWRQKHVNASVRIEWDISVRAVCWSVWNERNNRIFFSKIWKECSFA